jgi:acetylornithine deacetylase/succinyl-diaminopimelate desuccinylase-like protein
MGRPEEWLSRLVRVPSVNPAQAGPRAGEPGEGRLAARVAEWFRQLGGEVETEEVLPGRPNVYGVWRGRAAWWAAVDVPIDTVGVEQMTGDPFDGRIAGGRVYGRGAVDTKATLGVVLALLEAMHARGAAPVPNLVVAATVDEEVDAQGAPASAAWMRRRGIVPDQMAVAEPTGCGPVVGHKGVLRLEIAVAGTPAHSAQPHLGANAVTAGARAVLALEEEDRRLHAEPPRTLLGPPTLTVTRIEGGRGLNVVPDRCVLGVDRRLVAGEGGAETAARLERIARDASPLPLEARTLKQIEAFSQAPDSPWVRQLAEWSGRAPAVVPYCTNAWAYAGLARELVVIGPGSIDQAHGVEEWVEIAELQKLAAIYARWLGLPAEESGA